MDKVYFMVEYIILLAKYLAGIKHGVKQTIKYEENR